MVQAIAASEILLSPKVLGIIDVGIMVEPIPIARVGLSAPGLTVGGLPLAVTVLGRSGFGGHGQARGQTGSQDQGLSGWSYHVSVPPFETRQIVIAKQRTEPIGTIGRSG